MTDVIDIAYFRQRLLKQRDEILSLQVARDASADTVKLDQTTVGRLSRMDALQQQAMAQDSQRRAENSLQRIAAALRRCDDGSYGYCLQCDEPIDPKRLELDSATTLCIVCAQARE
jgi:DnaK suppressor protein